MFLCCSIRLRSSSVYQSRTFRSCDPSCIYDWELQQCSLLRQILYLHHQWKSSIKLLQNKLIILHFIPFNLMNSNNISLEGTLFIQTFKDFVEGRIAEAQQMIPYLTLQFAQLEVVLKHARKQELIDFFKLIKKVASEKNLQDESFGKIEELIKSIQQQQQATNKQIDEELVNEGKNLVNSSKQKEAEVKFRELLKAKPSEETFISVALIELSRNKNVKTFIGNIEKALRFEQNKNNLALYQQAVKLLQKYKEWTVRFKCARRAISLGSKNPQCYLQLVQMGFKLELKLKEYLKIVSEGCPEGVEKCLALGLIYFTQNLMQKCLEQFRQGKGMIKQNQQKKKRAYKIFQETHNDTEFRKLSTFDKIDQFFYYMGKAYEKEGDESPFEAYQLGLTYNKNNLEIWKQILIYFHSKVNFQAQIFDVVENIIDFPQDDFEVNSIIVDLLYEIGEKQVLIQYISSLLSKLPNDDKSYYLAAKGYLQIGDYEKCKQLCLKCLTINAKNEEVYYFLGKISFHELKIQQARNYYKKAIQINPKQFLAYYNLGILQYNQNQYEDAIKSFQNAIQINPGFSQSYYLLINACLKIGDYENAYDKIQIILEGNQNSCEGIYYYAQIEYQRGNYNDAEKYFLEVLQKQPKHFLSLYYLAIIKIIQSNQSKQHLLKAQELIQMLMRQHMCKVEYKSIHGYLIMMKNQSHSAIQSLMSSIFRSKDYFETYYHLGCSLKNKLQNKRFLEDAQDLIAPNDDNHQSYYYSSFFQLGLQRYQYFLEKFNTYLSFSKSRIGINLEAGKNQISAIYRSLISHFEHLRRFYPQSNDIMLILGILNRDVGNSSKAHHFCKMAIQNQDFLHSIFIDFYNKNSKYHQCTNYLQFIYEFMFQVLFENNELEGMKFSSYLRNDKPGFIHNDAINFAVSQRKSAIIKQDILQVFQYWSSIFSQINKNRSVVQTQTQISKMILNRIKFTQQQVKLISKIIKILNINTQTIVEHQGLDALLDLIKWNPTIVEDKCFEYLTPISEFEDKIRSKISRITDDDTFMSQLQQKYIYYLIYKHLANQAYPFIYNDQILLKSLNEALHLFIDPNSKESLENRTEKMKNSISAILFNNLNSNINEPFKQENSKYSSQILFADYQQDQILEPLAQPSKASMKKQIECKLKSFRDPKLKSIQRRLPELNTLQKHIIKKPLNTQSLIVYASNRSSIFIPTTKSTYLIEDQDPFDF